MSFAARTTTIVAAILLALACVVPFVLWGNPYPPEAVRYWAWGVPLCVAMAMVAARAGSARAFPDSLSALLNRPSPVVFASLVSLATTTLAAFLAAYSFNRGASTPDEIAQLWQAKILLHGALSLPVDAAREFFSLETVVDVDRWYSQFPIGGPVMMMPGALFGAPWLVNPVLAGIAAAAFFHFARRAFGETQGRIMALLFVIAPMILLMAGTWMNHVAVLCFACCALAALVEWERATSMRRRLTFAALTGLALGAIVTIRPLDAIVVALTVGVFQVVVVIRDDWRRGVDLVVQALFGAVPVAFLLFANASTTGHAFTFGYDVLWGAGHRVGFHADPHGNVHTLRRGAELAMTYISELNMYLMAWPVPLLALLIAGLVAMRRVTRWDVLMLGLLGAQVAAYGAYWGEGEFLGPRFLYTALPTIIVLVVRGGAAIAERGGESMRRATVLLPIACAVVAWVPGISFNATGLARQARSARQNLKVDIAGAVAYSNAHHALIFLREPLGMRLKRRLWAIGVSRSDAAQLVAERDACSLLDALRAAEADSMAGTSRIAAVRRNAAALPAERLRLPDVTLHVASMASVTPECRAELEADQRIGSVPFGPALPLQTINRDGRLDGDIIFAADLGDRNEMLRARFADRAWYRLVSVPGRDGTTRIGLAPY